MNLTIKVTILKPDGNIKSEGIFEDVESAKIEEFISRYSEDEKRRLNMTGNKVHRSLRIIHSKARTYKYVDLRLDEKVILEMV